MKQMKGKLCEIYKVIRVAQRRTRKREGMKRAALIRGGFNKASTRGVDVASKGINILYSISRAQTPPFAQEKLLGKFKKKLIILIE